MKLYFRKYGSGHPLIILHGLYGMSDNWVSIGKILAKDFEVYIIDQRNHGKSPHSLDFDYNVMRDDLLEFMNSRSIEKAILLGHSMGGKTAMNFAVEFPDRVSSLIVVDIAPKSYIDLVEYKKEMHEHKNIVKALTNISLVDVNRLNDANILLKQYIDSVTLRNFLLKNIMRKKSRNDNITYSWKLNINAIQTNLTKILDVAFFTKNISQKLSFPTLFIKGEKSNYILDTDKAKTKKIFNTAEFVTILNTGHWLHAEEPIFFIKLVVDFIKSNSN